MNSEKLIALRDALNAVLEHGSPAAPAPAPVPPVAPAPAPAPAPAGESIWTADKIVRWVDRGAGARNARGARIVTGAQDPLGLLVVAAANPGRPVYSVEFPKTGRQLDGLVVDHMSRPAPAAPRPAPAKPPVAAPAPVAPPATKPLAALPADLMAQWVGAYPEAAGTLARILAAGIATRQYTYRDVLALGGIVPARVTK